MVEGSQIGAYRVLKQIGEGGMGAVWLAEHSMLGRRAAIKLLHNEFSSKPEVVTRFFNEARAATAIADPGIVQIFDFGQQPDGTAYIVMELLDGEALDKRLARIGALALGDALRIMRQVASTLGAAHARGIVHRDLKPENIFIVRDPEVYGGERAKVLDFGIAKLTGDPTVKKTQTSAVMGTPTYMSPEQCRGAGHVDQRSDVYSLGCVLFRLVCGRPPFDAEGVGELIVMHLRENPPLPSSLRAGIPPEVEQLILRCLAKDPAHRFSSGAELAIALGALTGSSPQLPAVSGHYAVASAPTTLSAATGVNSTSPPGVAKKSRAVPIMAGVLVAGAAAVGLVLATKQKPSEPKPAAKTEVPVAVAKDPTPAPPPAPAKPVDPNADVAARMKTVLAAFTTWSRDHAGAACPDATALGVDANDPWGHPFKATCTDQPGDQIIGLTSSGPDGTFGTADDVASWSLGHDVTDAARGARWTVAVAAPPAKPTTVAKPTPVAKPKPATKPARPRPTGGSVELDENGLPVSR